MHVHLWAVCPSVLSPARVQLIETGYSADYLEDWRLLPSSLGDAFAFRLSDGGARTGALLLAGSHFMFIADREQPLAATGDAPPSWPLGQDSCAAIHGVPCCC